MALWQDFRVAVRSLIRRPASAVVAIITFALGIGANTAIFSVVNATLIQPLPYQDSDRLVFVWHVGKNGVTCLPPAIRAARCPRPS